MAGLPQFRSTSMRQNVGEAIRQALLSGRFRPGEPLSEVALAAEMSVSRGPVREALLVLAQEGLVSHSQNHGFSVHPFTEQDAREVQQVRLPLEALALTLARERINSAELRQLSGVCYRILDSFKAGESDEWIQADLEFHTRIWAMSGNTRLLASLRNLMVPYFAYGSTFKISRQDLTLELLDRLHTSYIAFLEGDASQTAEECVRFHVGL